MALLQPKGRSQSEVNRILSEAIRTSNPTASWSYVREIYPDDGMVVFSIEQADGQPMKRYFSSFDIDAKGDVTLGTPEEVVVKEVYEIVATFSCNDSIDFSKAIEEDGSMIVPAILFECGVYPDKNNFSLSQDEADLILSDFSGIPIKIEHENTIFDGSIGNVKNAWRVGNTIFGTIEFPLALGQLLKGKAPKLSVGFNRDKKPREVSLVENPRIENAGVLAEFRAKPRTKLTMKLPAALAALFGGKESDAQHAINEAVEESPLVKQLREESAAKDSKIEALEKGQFKITSTATAESLANQVIGEGKVPPAAKDALMAQFTATLSADGGTTFSDGKLVFGPTTQSALEVYKAMPKISELSDSTFAGEKPQSKAEPNPSGFAQLNGGK
jgi:hypothetical protein